MVGNHDKFINPTYERRLIDRLLDFLKVAHGASIELETFDLIHLHKTFDGVCQYRDRVMRRLLILDSRDNIAVCLTELLQGEIIRQDDLVISILAPIPRGHKVAIKAIARGTGVIKYGEKMGHATSDISVGEHVHVHNVLGDRLSTEKQ